MKKSDHSTQKEKELVEDILEPIRASWSTYMVTIVSNGWIDIRHRSLNNIIATSPKGAMFSKVEHCSGEVKNTQFIANTLIKVIEEVELAKVMVQVITDNAPVCTVVGLIVDSTYDHIFGLLALSII
jgi:hypothetical protein